MDKHQLSLPSVGVMGPATPMRRCVCRAHWATPRVGARLALRKSRDTDTVAVSLWRQTVYWEALLSPGCIPNDCQHFEALFSYLVTMEPSRKRKGSAVWDHFDLILPTKVFISIFLLFHPDPQFPLDLSELKSISKSPLIQWVKISFIYSFYFSAG